MTSDSFSPAGSTTATTSRGSIRMSVLGPRGCPRTVVSSRGRRCQLMTANRMPDFRTAATPRAAQLVRDAVERVCYENEIDGSLHELSNLVRISFD